MTGKSKCKILKDIRRKIAEKNDIKLTTEECRFKGECSGTCTKCEAEVRYLERELEKRKNLGKKIALTGLAVGLAVSTSACDFFSPPAMTGDIDIVEVIDSRYLSITERFKNTSPSFYSLINKNDEERSSYLSGYTREEIRTEWTGTLIADDTYTDKFKIPYRQEKYYVTFTYDKDGKALCVDIEKAEETEKSADESEKE